MIILTTIINKVIILSILSLLLIMLIRMIKLEILIIIITIIMLNLEITYLFIFSGRLIKINQNLYISNNYILLKPYTMPNNLVFLLIIIF